MEWRMQGRDRRGFGSGNKKGLVEGDLEPACNGIDRGLLG